MLVGRLTLSGKYAYVGTGPFFSPEKDRPTTLAQDIWATDYIDYSSPYFDPQRAKNFLLATLANGFLIDNTVKVFNASLYTYRTTGAFFTGYGLYLAFIGLIFGTLHKKFRLLTLYLSLMWLAGLIWVSLFMLADYRYLVYAFPFFFYLEGLAIYASYRLIASLAGLLKKRKIVYLSLIIAQIILPGFLLVDFFVRNINFYVFTNTKYTGLNKDFKLIGEWIKSQEITVIGARQEAITFYSDAKLVYMPYGTPDQIIKYMKLWGVEYLLVRPTEVGYAFAAPIYDKNLKNPDLTLMHRFWDGSLVWKIKLTDQEKQMNERIKREKKDKFIGSITPSSEF